MNFNSDILAKTIFSYGKIAVALSGGLDSSVLLAFSARILGAKNCMAIVADSPYMMGSEQSEAKILCDKLGVELLSLNFEIPKEIENNPPDRCYICKKKLFSEIKRAAFARGFTIVADGTNTDDLADYRPGMKAIKELEVKSPFLESMVGKAQIRELARELGIENKVSNACLMTRFEHLTFVDAESLRRVDTAEDCIRSMGFDCVRVRVFKNGIRIELDSNKISDFNKIYETVSLKLKDLGFDKIIEVREYSRGAMNSKNG